MPNPVDIVVVTIGTADNAQSIANSPSPGNIAWAGFQTAINAAPFITQVPAQVAGISQIGAMLTVIKMQVDMIEGQSPALGDVITVVGAGITLVAAVAAVGTVAAPAVALVGAANLVVAASALYANSQGYTTATVTDSVASLFSASQRQVPRRDPLTLDLNGNGIETIAPNLANPILFDHEGNGMKTGTGWIAPSDGFLVLDRNGNGTIDDGTELFGDNTPLYGADGTVAGTAADGFAALAQQDTNADGVVNSSDANFANLRVWQDLNQDGISDAGELKALDQLGIASINVGKTENSRILPNGNEIADLGTFVRTDGTTGSAGVSSRMADVNLAADTFHRSFTDVIPTTADTVILPDMLLPQTRLKPYLDDIRERVGEAANDSVFEMMRVG